jgi:glutamyl/glutaminyl-tRNA synthetase
LPTEVICEVNESNYTTDFIAKIKEKSPHKGKKLFHPIRAMVTGRLSGPDLDQAIPYIGYTNLKKRLEYAHKRYC